MGVEKDGKGREENSRNSIHCFVTFAKFCSFDNFQFFCGLFLALLLQQPKQKIPFRLSFFAFFSTAIVALKINVVCLHFTTQIPLNTGSFYERAD